MCSPRSRRRSTTSSSSIAASSCGTRPWPRSRRWRPARRPFARPWPNGSRSCSPKPASVTTRVAERAPGGRCASGSRRRDRRGERDRPARAVGRARVARGDLPRAHGRPGRARRMTRLFAAELLKLQTLRSTWGFALVALLFAGLVAAGNIGGTAQDERFDPELQFRIAARRRVPGLDPGAPPRDHPRDQRVPPRHDRADAARDASARSVRRGQAPHRRRRRRRF